MREEADKIHSAVVIIPPRAYIYKVCQVKVLIIRLRGVNMAAMFEGIRRLGESSLDLIVVFSVPKEVVLVRLDVNSKIAVFCGRNLVTFVVGPHLVIADHDQLTQNMVVLSLVDQ